MELCKKSILDGSQMRTQLNYACITGLFIAEGQKRSCYILIKSSKVFSLFCLVCVVTSGL